MLSAYILASLPSILFISVIERRRCRTVKTELTASLELFDENKRIAVSTISLFASPLDQKFLEALSWSRRRVGKANRLAYWGFVKKCKYTRNLVFAISSIHICPRLVFRFPLTDWKEALKERGTLNPLACWNSLM